MGLSCPEGRSSQWKEDWVGSGAEGSGRESEGCWGFVVLPAAVRAGTACWRPARLTQQLLVAKHKMKKLSSIS